jgi:RNA polymerase sigma-70 factor (ECF subfamily)
VTLGPRRRWGWERSDQSESSERSLIQQANAGDAAALSALYLLHRDWVVGLAFRMIGSREDALDVLQETFLWFFQRLPIEPGASLRSFLYPAVKHRCIDLARRRAKVVPLHGEIELPWDGGLDDGDFQRLVARLSVEQREVVTLRFAAGMQLDEIAAALAIPVGTVKSRLHHALEKLTPEVSARGT